MVSKELRNLLGKIEKYRGEHVVVVEDEIVTVENEEELEKAVDKFEKKYPDKVPLITYVPKRGVLVL
ncbi:MAG: DUF5678 domain-containing protein [Methanocellales archaeon]|nr:DUF5678 domain-containing protein [Methanocellales archaeon]MDI6903506.1 DUF5678 domain-containing protein [Methanocellales archaeon]